MRKRRLKAEGEHMGDVGKIRKKRSAALRPGRFGCFRLLLLTLLFLAAAGLFLDGDDPKKNGAGAEDAGVLPADAFPAGSVTGEGLVNLAMQEGVSVTADSAETEAFSPEKAADGNRTDAASRWSSANEAGQPVHWLMFTFAEEKQVSFVRLYWERLNVEGFVLESSRDGKNWVTAAEITESPEANEQCIVLDNPAPGQYFRIRTTDVSDSEANQYLYYQNVSLLEAELYEEVPLSYSLGELTIEIREDGSRHLVLPAVPEDVEIEIAGADYEQVIGPDGTVYPTVEEKEVEVGFLLTRNGASEETPGYRVTVPAAELTAAAEAAGFPEPFGTIEAAAAAGNGAETEEETLSENPRPSLTPEAAEWRGGSGRFFPGDGGRILVDETWQEEAPEALSSLQASLSAAAGGPDSAGGEVRIVPGTKAEIREGDIYLGTAPGELGLGNEGYLCEIRPDGVILLAQEKNGLIWGVNTLCQLLETKGAGAEATGTAETGTAETGTAGAGTEGAETNGLPCGVIRDYPRYSVRGFSIDIGRRMVSMEMLREMVLELSAKKMNTLSVHLNDNEILSTSGKNDSIADAFTAYSGFRLESSLQNEKGENITSRDGAFTKEEWKEFTEWAAGLGVEVVPEIDTPAHSLAITKVFPETALADEPENVDQLDLSSEKTISLIEGLWKEYLDGEDPVFAEGGTVHIGMDEYFGNAQDYKAYMRKLISLVTESGRTVRMWGSLSLIEQANGKAAQEGQSAYGLWNGKEEGAVSPEQIQVQVWSSQWADPQKTWRAGYTVINSLNSSLYIIPGGGYDSLDLEALSDWEPNEYPMGGQTQVLPAWSPRTAGAIYCLWNDTIGSLDAGVSEEGIFDRFVQPLSLLSGKLW